MEQQRLISRRYSDIQHIHLPDLGVLRPIEKTGSGLGELKIAFHNSKASHLWSLFHL